MTRRLEQQAGTNREAWATVSAVVCMTGDNPASFTDDVHTTCAGCGINIYHRPYIPAHFRKVCIDCALRHGQTSARS
jgi:hypothetical protein